MPRRRAARTGPRDVRGGTARRPARLAARASGPPRLRRASRLRPRGRPLSPVSPPRGRGGAGAPELVARAAEIGAALGLRRVPSISLLAARVPPMLWPASPRPRLLLPRDLLPDLDADERDALLAHELAHVRRRDHWVRFLEIGATALFWWYPVAWWSRRALRRAEERCCDEWVLRALPDSARAYASGILKSLTFLAEAPVALPETASGAGPIRDLESRLKEILMTSPRPRSARPIRLRPRRPSPPGCSRSSRPSRRRARRRPRRSSRCRPTTSAAARSPAREIRRPAPAPLASPASPVPAPAPPASAPRAAVLAAPRSAPAPDARPVLAGGEDATDPALEKERRALDAQRRELHISSSTSSGVRSSSRPGPPGRRRRARSRVSGREGDAAGMARAEKRGALRGRQADLVRRQLDLQVRQVQLEAEQVRAAEAGGAEKDSDARARDAERAEAELEYQQQALEAESEKLEREARALEAEERVQDAPGGHRRPREVARGAARGASRLPARGRGAEG